MSSPCCCRTWPHCAEVEGVFPGRESWHRARVADRDRCATLRSFPTALDDIPALAVTDDETFQLKQGRSIVLLPRQAKELKEHRRPRMIGGKDCTFTALAERDGVAVALGDAQAGKFQPTRVFNLTPTGSN